MELDEMYNSIKRCSFIKIKHRYIRFNGSNANLIRKIQIHSCISKRLIIFIDRPHLDVHMRICIIHYSTDLYIILLRH